jgi:drug/metabolite transporter (DMT)-like permease
MLRGFRLAPLSVATPVVASWALPAAIVGVLWSGETPTGAQGVGGALIVGGAAANGALARGGAWHGPKAEAIGWAAAGSVGFGVMAAGVSRLNPSLGEVLVIPAAWATQWLFLAPVVARMPLGPPRAWASVVGMAALEAVGFVLYAMATAREPVAVVSPPASLSPLLTVLFAAVVLREPVGPARWAAIAAAVVGTVMLAG